MARISKRIAEMVEFSPRQELEDSQRNVESHHMKKWVGGSDDLPYTLNEQAKFYEKLLPLLSTCKGLLGTFVFCWRNHGKFFSVMKKITQL